MDLMNGRVLEPDSKMVIENYYYILIYILITRRLARSLSLKNVLNIFGNFGRSQKTYTNSL